MTNKDKTGTARQQARRTREREWLAAHGFKSWEALHTQLMNGEIALDRATPAYSKPKYFNALHDQIDPEVAQLSKAIISKKKGKQS